MIEAWAEKLAVSIKNSNEKQTGSVAVMQYALIIVINFLIPYSAAALVGLLTGQFTETLLAIAAFVLIRSVSGGYHLQSSTWCMVATLLVVALPPHLPFPQDGILYTSLFSLLLFAIFAPANIRGYARMPEKYFPLMKLVSLVLVGSNLILQSPTLAIIFLLQGISLCFPNKRR